MKWGPSQSKVHKVARKETLASRVYHQTQREATGLGQALAIQEPLANCLPVPRHTDVLGGAKKKAGKCPWGIEGSLDTPSPPIIPLNTP